MEPAAGERRAREHWSLLYAALRRKDQLNDQAAEEALNLGRPDIPLRIKTYLPSESQRGRWRPRGPGGAIHVGAEDHDDLLVLRCSNAVMFVDKDERAKTVTTPRLTASALVSSGGVA